MNVRFSSAAEADVEAIRSWYLEQGHDLANQLLHALEQCLALISQNPQAYSIVHGEIRRALLRRFPYCIFYIVSSSEIVVLACLHGHRDPREWQTRRSE